METLIDDQLSKTHDSFMGDIDPNIREKRYVVTQSLVEQSRLASICLFIIFIILILLINGFIIIVILLSKTMRSSSRHVLIISVCLGDLLMGVFVLPVLVHLGLHHVQDVLDCPTFYAMRFFADFMIPSVTTLAMLALNIDYILRLCCSTYSEGGSRTALIVFLFLLPWILSDVLLIPLYIDGMSKVSGTWRTTCDINMGGYLTRTLLIVSFFPQAGLLLIFNLIVSVLYLFRRESYSLDVCGERIRAPVDICLASFAVILHYTPVFLVKLLTTEGYLGCQYTDECNALNILYVIALWMMFTKSWILPLAWLACRDTRACVRQILGCC